MTLIVRVSAIRTDLQIAKSDSAISSHEIFMEVKPPRELELILAAVSTLVEDWDAIPSVELFGAMSTGGELAAVGDETRVQGLGGDREQRERDGLRRAGFYPPREFPSLAESGPFQGSSAPCRM
jgi:hypothetical protein